MSTARAFFTNMSVPMPLPRKLRLVFRNQFTVKYGSRSLHLLQNQSV